MVMWLFQGDYENLKGWTSWYHKYASRIVQKGLQGYGQRNRHNCITQGVISTTTSFKCKM